MRSLLLPRAALAAVLAGLAVAAVPVSAAEPLPFRVPPGYRVVRHDRVVPGVEHLTLRSERPLHVVEVGVVRKGSGHRAEVRHAGPRSRGHDRALAGTSDLCGDCAYATNGDYAYRRPNRVVGRPIGGIVEGGVVLVSPNDRHQQASYTYGGGFTTARLDWSVTVTRGEQRLAVHGKNVPREPGRLVLYTPDYVRSTGTGPHGAELTLELSELRPGTPMLATMTGFALGRGDAPVGPGTVVLSGSGAAANALRRLWDGGGPGAAVELAETLSPADVWSSVGAGHVLLRDGRRWLAPENAPHLTSAHPRTFAGVLPNGDLFNATVDGRERNAARSTGMPLDEAVGFFAALGAREVVNMDGGGSTTFVRRGEVVNVPSEGAERPVTTAIVVVPGRVPSLPARAAVPASPRDRPAPAARRDAAPLLAVVAPPAPATPEPTPLAVWVAAGNIAAVATAGTGVWIRGAGRQAG